MARALRMEYPGAVYHVTCRMVGSWRAERARLFAGEADHERFLEALSERVARFGVRLYLFACMTNHFHLVFETPGANCSGFMQSLATAYTVYYNLRHRRHGHLLDGRFKAKLVAGDEYLLRLSRYVHLNPVRTKAWRSRPLDEQVEGLREYCWSSYPGYVDPSKKLDVVHRGRGIPSGSGPALRRTVADRAPARGRILPAKAPGIAPGPGSGGSGGCPGRGPGGVRAAGAQQSAAGVGGALSCPPRRVEPARGGGKPRHGQRFGRVPGFVVCRPLAGGRLRPAVLRGQSRARAHGGIVGGG